MKTQQDLIALFKQVATEVDKREFRDITGDSVITDLGIDSLSMMQIVGEMELRLNIMIPDEDLVELVTVGDLVKVVARRIEGTYGNAARDADVPGVHELLREGRARAALEPLRRHPLGQGQQETPAKSWRSAPRRSAASRCTCPTTSPAASTSCASRSARRGSRPTGPTKSRSTRSRSTEYLMRSGKRTDEQMVDFQNTIFEKDWELPVRHARAR